MTQAMRFLVEDPGLLLSPERIADRWSAYNDTVDASVLRMITQLFADNNKTWRSAAREGGRGKEIYEALQQEFAGRKGQRLDEIVQRRFGHLISYWREGGQRLPDDLTQRALRFVEQETMKGRNPKAIEADLRKLVPVWSDSSIKRFARTAVSSSQTALTLARMEDFGSQWYVWRTSKDQRVRDSHRHMDRVMVWIREPPSPEKLIGEKFQGVYHAGQTWNCRCYPEPVIDLEYLRWPHKVHFQGRIRSMSRKEFERRFGRM